MHVTKIVALCLLVMGLAAWKCGGEKKVEEAKQQMPADVAPADINTNQPADMTAPGSSDVAPGTGDANMGDSGMDASPSEEVPVGGADGVEPSADYMGEQGVEAGPAEPPQDRAQPEPATK